MPRYRRRTDCSRGFQNEVLDSDSDSSSDSSWNISVSSASPPSQFTPSPIHSPSPASSPGGGAGGRHLSWSSSSDNDSEVDVAEVPVPVINDDGDDSDHSSNSSVDLNINIFSPENSDQGDLNVDPLSPVSSGSSNSFRSNIEWRNWRGNSPDSDVGRNLRDNNGPPAPEAFGLPLPIFNFSPLPPIGFDRSSSHSSTTDDSIWGGSSSDTDFSNITDSSLSRARLRLNLTSATSALDEHSEARSDISVAGSSISSDSGNSTSRAVGEFFRSISQGHEPVESESTPRAPISMNNTAMTGSRRDALSYECSVCLEALDGPASIDLNAPGPAEEEASAGMQHLLHQLVDAVGLFSASANANASASASAARGSGGRQTATRGRRSGASCSSRSRQRGPNVNDENASLTDVVATHCGHLYHQVCLMKWFTQQGRRTCPSCRKNVPASKLIRLYPSCTAAPASAGSGNQPAPVPSTSGNGPSTSSSASVSAPTGGAGAPNSGSGCAECRDLRDIHNTLINDYTSLQERYNTMRDDEDMKNAQISSLEEENARNVAEIAQLRSELEGIRGTRPRTRTRTRTPPSQAGSKRRRY